MALPVSSQTAALQTDEQCLAYLEALRWPGGVACPNCGNQKVSRFSARGKSGKVRHICQCLDRNCKYQFSATTGTIFHDSHLPLSKWYEAMRLLSDPAGDTSINQLRFVLGVQYKTAKNVAERIQLALAAGSIEVAAARADRAGQPTLAPASAAAEASTPKAAAARAASKLGPRVKKTPARTPVRSVPPPALTPPPRPAGPPTVVDSILSVFTSAMNLGVKPPLAAVSYLKKKILD